jgi:elongation factor P
MATTSDIRNGLVIEHKGDIFTIVDFLHVKPGKGGAFVRTTLKSVTDGHVIEETFRAGERIKPVRLEEREMQYLYKDGDFHYFMDTETYEQQPFDKELLGDTLKFLKENDTVAVEFYESKPVTIELPTFVNLEVIKTDPGVRGDTATGGSKPATLQTGAVIQVPLFVKEGITVKVDTRTGEYVERV